MEDADDMIVVIIGDDEDIVCKYENELLSIKEEPLDQNEVTDMIATAQRYGQPLELDKAQGEVVFVTTDEFGSFTFTDKQSIIKEEPDDSLYFDENEEFVLNKDEEYIPDENECDSDEDKQYSNDESELKAPKRISMVPLTLRKSFIDDLRKSYPELKSNEMKLIKTIAEIMRNCKAPDPPQDYFIMNNINFECCTCGTISNCIPAAARHYQEKHGPRYLMCFACGVDFRSKTNLYKHEKKCAGPDAEVLLKARALFLGRKGRGRPYLPDPSTIPVLKYKNDKRFPCYKCSANFRTSVNLEAHLNMHLGVRPYACDKCPSAYTSLSALSRHQYKHSDQQYICDHCNRPFKVRAALVSHLDTHNAIPRFGCGSCPKRFATKNALNHHVRSVHLRLPMPCACPICDRRYPRMSLLKDHMQKKHGMSIITRKMFFKALPTMTEEELLQAKEILESQGPFINLSADIDVKQEARS